mmetsp:Transcript_63007/g.146724  ORF Transcript_63007/g.146724 Transcript_63007/m.146724 type:complete len:234 (+) Transcript_63007:143-844(+)
MAAFQLVLLVDLLNQHVQLLYQNEAVLPLGSPQQFGLHDQVLLADTRGLAPHSHAALDKGVYVNVASAIDESQDVEHLLGVPDVETQGCQVMLNVRVLEQVLEVQCRDGASLAIVQLRQHRFQLPGLALLFLSLHLGLDLQVRLCQPDCLLNEDGREDVHDRHTHEPYEEDEDRADHPVCSRQNRVDNAPIQTSKRGLEERQHRRLHIAKVLRDASRHGQFCGRASFRQEACQ